jgi:hypothetical protein
MNLEDARIVGHQESPSTAEMALQKEEESCLTLFAHNAARKPKFLSSHVWTNLYIAAIAFQIVNIISD